jgi:4-hydroxybutyryl-CoA dehydratase/vinylacetyl-CoA-Delta-isomerase
MHGAGSPQAQKVMYSSLSNLDFKKECAMKIAGIPDAEADKIRSIGKKKKK